MQKRGQVTIFVIIGIVILIAFALVFLVASGKINLKQGKLKKSNNKLKTESRKHEIENQKIYEKLSAFGIK